MLAACIFEQKIRDVPLDILKLPYPIELGWRSYKTCSTTISKEKASCLGVLCWLCEWKQQHDGGIVSSHYRNDFGKLRERENTHKKSKIVVKQSLILIQKNSFLRRRMQKYVCDIVCVTKRATNLASTITKLILNEMFEIFTVNERKQTFFAGFWFVFEWLASKTSPYLFFFFFVHLTKWQHSSHTTNKLICKTNIIISSS